VAETKRKKYVQQKWLLENYVTWSKQTLKRRIEDCGFPAINDENGYVFDLDQVDLWFKKRKQTS